MPRLRRSALLLLLLLVRPAGPAGCAASSGELSEAAGWLQGYLRIDSTTAAGEARAAGYLARILHREGLATRLLVSPEGHTSLYARLEAEHPDSGPLVLLHHLDVVPPGPGWKAEPFGGDLKDGRLWGRGALDIKSLGVVHLEALLDLARRHTPLRRDVIFLAVADEERGGGEGVRWLLERHADLFEGTAAALGEGGANRRINGRDLWAGIEVAQKRPLWLRIWTTGRGGHGAAFNPGSAVHQLVLALSRALEIEPEWRVTEAARLYLGALAPLHNDTWRPIFSDLDRYVLPEGPTRQLMPGLASLFLDTFQVTMLEGASKINVIPERAEARVDVRLLPETDADAYLARVKEALGPGVQVEVLLSSPPVPPSPVDDPVYRAVASVLERDAPAVPAFIPGLTDSRYFRERGIPAYGVSPFFLGPYDLLGIHGSDESIPVRELDLGVERMRRIVALCAARQPALEAGSRSR